MLVQPGSNVVGICFVVVDWFFSECVNENGGSNDNVVVIEGSLVVSANSNDGEVVSGESVVLGHSYASVVDEFCVVVIGSSVDSADSKDGEVVVRDHIVDVLIEEFLNELVVV